MRKSQLKTNNNHEMESHCLGGKIEKEDHPLMI
jgi:hypothetical protein